MYTILRKLHVDMPEGYEALMVVDPEPDPTFLDQEVFADRKTAYERGEFEFVGIVVRRRCACCNGWEYSPGLWNVESDADADYLEEVAREEISILTHGAIV